MRFGRSGRNSRYNRRGYNQIDPAYYANVVGIEVDVNEFQRNIEFEGEDTFQSAVFEAGGITHVLTYERGKVNTSGRGRIQEKGTYTLDGKSGYKDLFDVFNERNLLNNQSIYDYRVIRVKMLNGQVMGTVSPTGVYPYGIPYPTNPVSQAPLSQQPINTTPITPTVSPSYTSSSSYRRTSKKKSSKWISFSALLVIGLFFFGIMGYFIYAGNNIQSNDLTASTMEVVLLDGFFEEDDGSDRDAYGLILDNDTYTIYFIDREEINLDTYLNREEPFSGDIVLKVSNEKNIFDYNYRYDPFTKAAQVQALTIDDDVLYSYDEYLASVKNSNQMTLIILGVIGGIFVVLSLVTLIRKK